MKNRKKGHTKNLIITVKRIDRKEEEEERRRSIERRE